MRQYEPTPEEKKRFMQLLERYLTKAEMFNSVLTDPNASSSATVLDFMINKPDKLEDLRKQTDSIVETRDVLLRALNRAKLQTKKD